MILPVTRWAGVGAKVGRVWPGVWGLGCLLFPLCFGPCGLSFVAKSKTCLSTFTAKSGTYMGPDVTNTNIYSVLTHWFPTVKVCVSDFAVKRPRCAFVFAGRRAALDPEYSPTACSPAGPRVAAGTRFRAKRLEQNHLRCLARAAFVVS